jgi:hypothetical protein
MKKQTGILINSIIILLGANYESYLLLGAGVLCLSLVLISISCFELIFEDTFEEDEGLCPEIFEIRVICFSLKLFGFSFSKIRKVRK